MSLDKCHPSSEFGLLGQRGMDGEWLTSGAMLDERV